MNRSLIALILIISNPSSFGYQIPLPWLGSEQNESDLNLEESHEEHRFSNDIADGVLTYQDTIREVELEELKNKRNKEKKYRLDRFDLQFGASASGEIGVLGLSGGSAVEFIWQRNLKDGHAGDDIDLDTQDNRQDNGQNPIEPTEPSKRIKTEEETRTIEVNYSTSAISLSEALIEQTNLIINLNSLRKRFRKRIIRKIRKDSERLTYVIRSLATMPQVGDWYVGGFFKNYHFKTGLKIGATEDLEIGAGYDLRLRFRFKVRQIPFLKTDVTSLNLAQKKLRVLMSSFNRMGQSSRAVHKQFQLKRVWSIHTVTKTLKLMPLELSKGKGVQIEFKKKQNANPLLSSLVIDEQDLVLSRIQRSLIRPGFFNHKFISIFDNLNIKDHPNELSLHQIRIKYSGNLELGFEIASIEKDNTIEYHYKR